MAYPLLHSNSPVPYVYVMANCNDYKGLELFTKAITMRTDVAPADLAQRSPFVPHLYLCIASNGDSSTDDDISQLRQFVEPLEDCFAMFRVGLCCVDRADVEGFLDTRLDQPYVVMVDGRRKVRFRGPAHSDDLRAGQHTRKVFESMVEESTQGRDLRRSAIFNKASRIAGYPC